MSANGSTSAGTSRAVLQVNTPSTVDAMAALRKTRSSIFQPWLESPGGGVAAAARSGFFACWLPLCLASFHVDSAAAAAVGEGAQELEESHCIETMTRSPAQRLTNGAAALTR